MASQALLKAVTAARLRQTRLLLQMGADVNVKDVEGQTPIMRALCLPDVEVRTRFLRVLLKAGALVSLCDKQSRNALMWACRVGSVEDVSLLLLHADLDLNINAQDAGGQTALWTAVEGDKVETVQELIKVLSRHELNFEVEDRTGVTPAQLAAKLGHLDCLRTMIRHLDSVDKTGYAFTSLDKLNSVLRSVSTTNGPEVIAETIQPQEGFKPVPDPPTIQVISAHGRQVRNHIPFSKTENQQTGNPALSHSCSKSPSRTSTPISNGQLAWSRSPSFSCLRRQTAEQSTHGHSISVRLPRLRDTTFVEHGDENRDPSLLTSTMKRVRSSSDLSELLSEGSETVVIPPVRRRVVDRGSVLHSLPELFDIHAQQMSLSFRKSAAPKPPPPKPKPQQQQGWSRLKGVAIMARLTAKGPALPGITAAARSLSDGPSPPQDSSPAVALARLLFSKRRTSGGIKHANA